MTTTDANPPLPEFRTDYLLMEVDADYLAQAVKPKQFIHIDQSECIACEGCVDICPWKCIHMQTVDCVDESYGVAKPGDDPNDAFIFTIDDDVCTRCALCVDRCPTGVIILGKVGDPPATGDLHQRVTSYGYGYGMRLA
jgi:formate hydrogenlyase subunit 6/NADH:ubiquinone oxidoreductase subunit I